jgi:nicotinamidase-related amidase
VLEDDIGRRRLLVCLDLLEPAGEAEDPPAFQRCLGNSRRLLEHARDDGWEIVHCLGRDLPARAVGGLEPLASEAVYVRDGVSAFSSRAFRKRMRQWPAPELVIIGCSLTTSCLATALAAFDRDIPGVLVLDAISVKRDEVTGAEALARAAARIASPFVRMLQTDDFVGRRRSLELVSAGWNR